MELVGRKFFNILNFAFDSVFNIYSKGGKNAIEFYHQ